MEVIKIVFYKGYKIEVIKHFNGYDAFISLNGINKDDINSLNETDILNNAKAIIDILHFEEC
jgi:hypothetical protein